MDSVLIGFLTSALLTVVLLLLFSYEARTGKRFLGRARAYADVAVVESSRALHRAFRFIGRDLIRQFGRYLYHQALRGILAFTRRFEDTLRNAIRTNRTLARTSDEEREVRSKLEEVAYHKATVALSEEEKRQHREKVLEEGF